MGSESCVARLALRGIGAFARAIVLVLIVAPDVLAQGKGSPSDSAARDSASKVAARCTNAVNPHKRSFECNTAPIGAYDNSTNTLSKAWGGVRNALGALGITPTFSYTAQPMTSNTTAVGSRGWSWIGSTDLGLAINGEKLFGLTGFQVYVAGSYATGPELSEKIGNQFAAQGAAVGYGLWLTEFYVQQTFAKGNLTLAAGRLAPAGLWSGAPVFGMYVNGAISDGTPDALFINDFAYTSPPPGTQWGIQALYNFSTQWQLGVGLFNNSPRSSEGFHNGLDWTFRQGNTGALLVAQVNYLFTQGPHDPGPWGQYSVGISYDSNVFPTLQDTGTTLRGMYALWVMASQMVFREGDPLSQRGLTVWGAVSHSWSEQISKIPWSGSVGLSWKGPVASRSSDVAGVAGYAGTITSAVPGTTAETVLELNYRIAVTGGLWITPDYQYILATERNSGADSWRVGLWRGASSRALRRALAPLDGSESGDCWLPLCGHPSLSSIGGSPASQRGIADVERAWHTAGADEARFHFTWRER